MWVQAGRAYILQIPKHDSDNSVSKEDIDSRCGSRGRGLCTFGLSADDGARDPSGVGV